MKSTPKIKPLFVIALGIVITFSALIIIDLNSTTGNKDTITVQDGNLRISALSGKIHIDNNWTAAKAAGICTGNGIYSDPYIIEDLVIDAGGSGSGIWIENSDVYFKIENCSVFNSGGYFSTGIKLSYVSNSRLIDNNCSSNVWGIYLHNSNYNTVSGNSVNNNVWGISLGWGVSLGGNYNTVSGNTANDNSGSGIKLNGTYNTVSGNTASNNGEGIRLWGNNNIISGNSVNNNGWGIILGSNYNTVSGNTANDNSGSGIYLDGDYNTVSGNTANYNSNGISLYNSDNNDISGNALIGNDKCIVEENCEGNIFENNDCGKDQPIPGYNLLFLLGILSVVAIIKSKKLKKS